MDDKWALLHIVSKRQNGNLETVQSLLERGTDIHLKTDDGNTALLLAADSKRQDVCQLLIEAGADLNCCNIKKFTFLHYASKNGWLDIVEYLLEKGVDMHSKTVTGDTPLLLAACNKRKDIVKLLIEEGADINCNGSWHNFAVIHYASKYGWLDILQSLLEKGVEIPTNNDCGWSPLLLAGYCKHKDVFDALINAGVDINGYNSFKNTALHYASLNGWLDSVQCLLKKGADTHTDADSGWTPLLAAASHKHKDVVQLLIDAGVDVNFSGGWNKYTALHYASINGWLEIVQSLLKLGAFTEAKCNKGETPLLLAVTYDYPDVIECLIDGGADIDYLESDLLHFAAKNGYAGVLKSLLKKGVNIEGSIEDGKTPLHTACIFNKIEIINLLINAGADVNAQAIVGYTPLSCIILRSYESNMIELLIESGAYIQAVDSERILKSSKLRERMLKPVDLGAQMVINEFNLKDLPELYKLFGSDKNLPRMEKMKIVRGSQVAYEITESVRKEQQVKGFCNVCKLRPIVLKMLCVKSLIQHCENIKK